MRVKCEVEEIELEGDYGDSLVPSVCVTCTRCDHQVESFGTGSASIRRCLAIMREECPEEENNFYTCEDADED